MQNDYEVVFKIPVKVRVMDSNPETADKWVESIATENLKTFRWDHKNANNLIVEVRRVPRF